MKPIWALGLSAVIVAACSRRDSEIEIVPDVSRVQSGDDGGDGAFMDYPVLPAPQPAANLELEVASDKGLHRVVSETVRIAERLRMPRSNPNPDGSLLLEARDAQVAAPMVRGPATLPEGATEALWQPDGTCSEYDLVAAASNACLGRALFTITNPKTDTYFLSGLALAPSESSNSFFVRIGRGPLMAWHLPASPLWRWSPLVDEGGRIRPLELPAGTVEIEIVTREDGAHLAKLALTTTPGGDPSVLRPRSAAYDEIVVPLDRLKSGAAIKMRVVAEDGKPYEFAEPTLVLPSGDVRLEKVHLVFNDMIVSKQILRGPESIASPGARLSPTRTSAPRTRGPDADAVSFEVYTP